MHRRQSIVRAAIHPGIGVARVGNSPEEFFVGPELPYPVAAPDGGYRDEAGALKRQAARFRLYGYDAAGELVGEITADDAEIEWSVHLANKKAAWYEFSVALDIPEWEPAPRRNPAVAGSARERLEIDPGVRRIGGRDAGEAHRFDSGTFLGTPVYLGELRVDGAGRLLVLGGHGRAASAYPHSPPTTFANNSGWHDDIADGPVEATVRVGGRVIPVDPAWVVVAPPNYAPDIISVQTLYDVLYDTYQDNWLAAPARPSFARHIAPLLSRFCDLQWVNYGFFVQFGWGAPYEFARGDMLARLGDAGPGQAELRRQIFNMFRNPASGTLDVEGWPPMYGDDQGGPAASPRQLLAITKTQYAFLRAWAAGDFEADWDSRDPSPPQRIEEAPLAEQPELLDRAALTFCLGGPFHPGCELTWPARHASLYRAPFRIRPRAPGQPEPDYGDALTRDLLRGERSPLLASGPGDLTRWMAVPWHTDTASCQAGYDPQYDPYLPTFWPARVPNHVLREQEYAVAVDPSRPIAERLAAFQTRRPWPRLLPPQYLDTIASMVERYGDLGVVVARPGPEDTDRLPATIYVEQLPAQNGPADGEGLAPDAAYLTRGPTEKTRGRRGPGQPSPIQPRSRRGT